MSLPTRPQRIIMTGGSGLAGRHVITHLLSHGHQVLNLDLHSLDNPSVHTIITDLTDQAQVLSALSTSQFSFPEFRSPTPLAPADAVIHFGAYPRPLLAPDHKVFNTNVGGTFNVIDAACRLGIRKIILASTQSAYGAAYATGEGGVPWTQFPVLEDYDANPEDCYGLSKLVAERVGRSYARRFGVDVYALRIGHVLAPGMYAAVIEEALRDVEVGRRIGWSYTDARDLGQMCERAVGTSGLGWQVFNAVNDGVVAPLGVGTREWLETLQPGIVLGSLDGREAPTGNGKIKRMLGFREEFRWEEEVERERAEEEAER